MTPGGEVEAGESDRATAERELDEELGIRPELVGPVQEASGGEYEHLGERVRNFDVFFAAQTERAKPRLTGVTAEEIALMQEARWWPVQELRGPHEPVFPVDIVKVAEAAWERVSAGNQAG